MECNEGEKEETRWGGGQSSDQRAAAVLQSARGSEIDAEGRSRRQRPIETRRGRERRNRKPRVTTVYPGRGRYAPTQTTPLRHAFPTTDRVNARLYVSRRPLITWGWWWSRKRPCEVAGRMEYLDPAESCIFHGAACSK
ncbi:hypothetical protein MTO96_015553 [Rhipicephalus appendiculatus]